jgi:hypothetical protein
MNLVTDRSLRKVNLRGFIGDVILQDTQAQNAANSAAPNYSIITIEPNRIKPGYLGCPWGFSSQIPSAPQKDSRLEKTKLDALERLYATYSECSRAGWDGYDASAASYESYVSAKRFIESFPPKFASPEIAIDPDGEVSLEWYCDPGRVFSVSISANAELTYAGKFSLNEKTHGTVPFAGELPQVILENIRRLFS